jgi:hypothetical protein
MQVISTNILDKPKYRIALVVCYFGKLPNYSCLVMRSAGENPTIDWFIYGDQPPDFELPPNVRFLSMTMTELHSCKNRSPH